ncbi:hypothetical protein PR048_023116 [Dryococelus australis]|uniref:DUF5641 domain-containing protein n=1 Tax=Dryococelus australis TaxID=614101 RepID=A0ABQ9GT55_9NEOP|nr:hypothetical protein PR048_023116 [Dryococelus australis]
MSPVQLIEHKFWWHGGGMSLFGFLSILVGERALAFEEYATLLAQVEAVINCRPLFELRVLTRGHFLIGTPQTAARSEDFTTVAVNLLSLLHSTFGSDARQEYLNTLQQRLTLSHNSPYVKEGQLMVVIEDSLPPLKWHIGRISEFQLYTTGGMTPQEG